MSAKHSFLVRSGLAALGVMAISCVTQTAFADQGITSVFSRTSDDYVRATLADGSTEPESYAFGKGGYSGSGMADNTIDNLGFMDIAHTLAAPLANQNFIPATDPHTTKLLIMVYWGATDGPMDFPQLSLAVGPGYEQYAITGELWDMSINRNAALLGYSGDLSMTGLKGKRISDDLNYELSTSRYYVVLMAYDFQLMWREKKHKLLWESRFSVREQGNDFTRALPAMAQYASEFFGRDSHGLLRTHVPDGRIYIGDPTVVGYLSGVR